MSNQINFNIISGVSPFKAELIGSLKPDQTFITTGEYSFNDVDNGVYILKISDANGCMFEKEIIVDPSITTTTTTKMPEDMIVIGQAQDPLLVFNPIATNKNGDYVGYPDSDIVTLYLWFKTLNGEPLDSPQTFSYSIEVSGDTGDSTFKFNTLSDQIHAEVQENITGPNDSILGDIIFRKGFIETFFEYTYYRGSTNKRYDINIQSPVNKVYPNLKTKDEAGTTFGISNISSNEIILNY